MFTTATASRRGTREYNCDAAAIHRMPGTDVVAAAIVDGIGNNLEVARLAGIAAEVAARVGARKGALLGILAAAELVAAPAAASVDPDGVAVLAVAEPGHSTEIAWTGDARAYGWDGKTLRRLTTDHTVGEYLRRNGGDHIELLARAHDDWLRSSLGWSTIASVHEADTTAPLVLLTSDGVHDQIAPGGLEDLVRDHQTNPQDLADAIVADAVADEDGYYRDDATVVVLQTVQPN